MAWPQVSNDLLDKFGCPPQPFREQARHLDQSCKECRALRPSTAVLAKESAADISEISRAPATATDSHLADTQGLLCMPGVIPKNSVQSFPLLLSQAMYGEDYGYLCNCFSLSLLLAPLCSGLGIWSCSSREPVTIRRHVVSPDS